MSGLDISFFVSFLSSRYGGPLVDSLLGQSPALESPIKATEVMTAAITLPPKEVKFAGDFLTPMPPRRKHSYISYCVRFWALMPISSHDMNVFFCGFGVALVALKLYKLAQPAKG